MSASQLKCFAGACLLLLERCKAQCRSAILQVALLPWRTARLHSPIWASHWHKRRPSSWRPPTSWCQQSSCAALCRTPSSTKLPSWHLQTRSSTIACCIVDCPVLPHAALSCLAPGCLALSCLALSCLVLSCLVLPCLALSCLALSCFVLSCLVLSCLVLSCLVLSCLVLSCLALFCLVLSCHVISCLALLYHVLSEWPLPCSCAFSWLRLCVQCALQLNNGLDSNMLM